MCPSVPLQKHLLELKSRTACKLDLCAEIQLLSAKFHISEGKKISEDQKIQETERKRSGAAKESQTQ